MTDRPPVSGEPRHTKRRLAREAYPSLGLEPFAVETEAGKALIVALDDPTRRIYWDDFRPSLEDRIRRIEAEASTGAALDGERLYRTYWRTQWDHPGIVGYKPARQWEQLQPEEQAIWNATAARLAEQEGDR